MHEALDAWEAPDGKRGHRLLIVYERYRQLQRLGTPKLTPAACQCVAALPSGSCGAVGGGRNSGGRLGGTVGGVFVGHRHTR